MQAASYLSQESRNSRKIGASQSCLKNELQGSPHPPIGAKREDFLYTLLSSHWDMMPISLSAVIRSCWYLANACPLSSSIADIGIRSPLCYISGLEHGEEDLAVLYYGKPVS